jgi:RIO kinase 1
MRLLARAGYAHGDLSAFNILVHRGRVVLIDLPQVVDVVINPQGATYLQRDCANVLKWFAARGLDDADADHLFGDLMAEAVARW